MEHLKDGSQVVGVVLRQRAGDPTPDRVREARPDLRHQAEAGEEDQSVAGWDDGWEDGA